MSELPTLETAVESEPSAEVEPPKKRGWPKGKKRGPRVRHLGEAVPPVERKPGRPQAAKMLDLSSGEWVDHGAVHIQLIESEIAWALEHMFGIPRGLVRKEFADRAKKVLHDRYPMLRKSAIHAAAEADDSFFVAIPNSSIRNFDRTIRLCDLIETVMFDGGFGHQDNPIA